VGRALTLLCSAALAVLLHGDAAAGDDFPELVRDEDQVEALSRLRQLRREAALGEARAARARLGGDPVRAEQQAARARAARDQIGGIEEQLRALSFGFEPEGLGQTVFFAEALPAQTSAAGANDGPTQSSPPPTGATVGDVTPAQLQAVAGLVRDAARSRAAVEWRGGTIVPASVPLSMILITAILGFRLTVARYQSRKAVSQPIAVAKPRRWQPVRPNPAGAALRTVRVLIAEDSPTARAHLQAVLDGCSGLVVVGEAADGLEALSLTFLLRPDVIVMDLDMPEMNGFEATARIMRETPTAVAAVSSNFDVYDTRISGEALRAGAVALLPKPTAPDHHDFERDARQFAETIAAVGQLQPRARAA